MRNDTGLEGPGDELAPSSYRTHARPPTRFAPGAGASVVAQLEAGSEGLPHAAEAGPTGLVEGHDGLKAVGLEGGMDAEQLAGAVVVDAKDRGLLAIEKHGRGGRGACPLNRSLVTTAMPTRNRGRPSRPS